MLVCVAQAKAIAQPDVYLEPNDMQADLNWLQSKVLAYHPSCEDSVRFDSVSTAFQMAHYEAEKPLQEIEFLRLLRQTLMPLRCGHTTAIPSRAFYKYYRDAKPKPLFPLQIYARPEGVYVRYNGSSDTSIAVGDRILTVNQEYVYNLSRSILDFLPGDGYHNSFKQFHLSLNFPTYYLFLKGPGYSYETGLIDSAGIFSTHVLSLRSSGKATTRQKPFRSFRIWKSDRFKHLGVLVRNPNVAILKIEGFGGSEKWYASAFEMLEKKKIQSLVLDLRGNSGGSLFNANTLLTYLLADTFSLRFERVNQPIRLDGHSDMSFAMRFTINAFKWFPSSTKRISPTCERQGNWLVNRFRFQPARHHRFAGKVIVLMDGGTFSAASLVAAAIRKHQRGLLMGEESGGAAEGSNAMVMPTLTLPRSKMRVTLPLYHINHEMNGLTAFRGLLPDRILGPDIELIIQGVDAELEQIAAHPEWFLPPAIRQ